MLDAAFKWTCIHIGAMFVAANDTGTRNGKFRAARILEIAASVGIDAPQLEKDMEEPRIRQVFERNLALASALGVRGTPAFVIGGEFVPGAIDADTLKRLIAEARKKPGGPAR